MRIERVFTVDGQSPYNDVEFRKTKSEIRHPDGSVVFAQNDIEVPSDWSQVACDVLAQKYFRKAGMPRRLRTVEEESVPRWLWRCEAAARQHQVEVRRAATRAGAAGGGGGG